MPQRIIPDVEEAVLQSLQNRASAHGRTAEAQARLILHEALGAKKQAALTEVNEFRSRLAASGRNFSDSAELIRENRGGDFAEALQLPARGTPVTGGRLM